MCVSERERGERDRQTEREREREREGGRRCHSTKRIWPALPLFGLWILCLSPSFPSLRSGEVHSDSPLQASDCMLLFGKIVTYLVKSHP